MSFQHSSRTRQGRLTLLICCALLASFAAGCGGGDLLGKGERPRVAAWPRFRNDVLNLGRGSGSGARGVKLWEFQTEGPIFDTPAVGPDGTVYVGTDIDRQTGKVYALDGATGAKKWEFPTPAPVEGSGMAIDANGTVYAGCNDHKLYALEAATGALKWAFEAGGIILSSPAFGRDGTVYVGSWFTIFVGNSTVGPFEGKVFALDPITGAKKWEFQTAGAVGSSPAVGADGTVYIGSYDGNVYALDGATGARKWEFLTGAPVYSSPAIGPDGTLYIGSFDRKVYALDSATGAKKWEFLTGDIVISSPAVGTNGIVYVGSFDRHLYALDAASGATRWDLFVGGNGGDPSPVIAADGTIYYEANDTGLLLALDPDTGATRWSLQLDPLRFVSPALGADGTIYQGSLTGKVYAIR